MEVFVDFGLFELIGLAGVAFASRDVRVRRRLRLAMSRAVAKLGRCVRCMATTAAGVAVSGVALAALGPEASGLIRIPLYAVFLAFAALAALHVGAILYRVLTRLEARVSAVAGGCNCGGRSRMRKEGLARQSHTPSRRRTARD